MASIAGLPAVKGDVLAQAGKVTVYDKNGEGVGFGNLISKRRTIVVFIRHFFCGTCQEYVKHLATVRPEALKQADADLVIIGCGGHQPITSYCETTGYAGKIFADPSRELYRLFELTENLDLTPEGQKKKDYVGTRTYAGRVLSSIWQGPIKHPQLIGKQGNISQLGGEFILGPGNQCSYASRMQHTEDHVDVLELTQAAGVEFP